MLISGTCRRISIGKRYSIPHTARIWHQAVFICLPAWRSTYQDIMKRATFTCLTQNGYTFNVSWKDELILWLVSQPSKGLCWKLFTSDIFIVYCYLPVLESCFRFMGTVNLLSVPPSYILKYRGNVWLVFIYVTIYTSGKLVFTWQAENFLRERSLDCWRFCFVEGFGLFDIINTWCRMQEETVVHQKMTVNFL